MLTWGDALFVVLLSPSTLALAPSWVQMLSSLSIGAQRAGFSASGCRKRGAELKEKKREASNVGNNPLKI